MYVEPSGWVFHARSQGWLHEPDLLAMPAAPMATQIAREVDRLSTGWPTLRQAWGIDSNRSRYPLGALLCRLPVLFTAFYLVINIPTWVGMYNGRGAYNPAHPETYQWGSVQLDHAMQLCFISMVCLFLLWFDHLEAVNPHKAKAVTIGVLGAVAAIEITRRVQALDKAVDNVNRRGLR